MARRAKSVPLLSEHHGRGPMRIYDAQSAETAMSKLNQRWGPNQFNSLEIQMRKVLIAVDMPTEPDILFAVNRLDNRTLVDREASNVIRKFSSSDRTPFSFYRGLDRLAERRGHQIGSDVWYASKILEGINDLRRATDPAEISHHAYYLGMIVKEANIVVTFGREFDTGIKQYRGLAENRQRLNAKRKRQAGTEHQRWTEAAVRLWQRKPKLSVELCAGRVIRELHLSRGVKTVADVIRPQSPKKVGHAR